MVKTAAGRFVAIESGLNAGPFTEIFIDSDFAGSVTDVAVTVAVKALEMVAGAEYFTVVAVGSDREPAPVAGARVQVTPLGSLVAAVSVVV